jgi:hypothetical protein
MKVRLGLNRLEAEDESEPEDDDELDASQRDRQRNKPGPLGDWESIGWIAAGLSRRVPGLEFMYVYLMFSFSKHS